MALVPIAVGQECLRAVGCGLMLRGVSSLLSSHCAGAAARVHSSTSPAAAPATSAAATARSSNHLCASGPSGLEAALARGEIAYVMLKVCATLQIWFCLCNHPPSLCKGIQAEAARHSATLRIQWIHPVQWHPLLSCRAAWYTA